MVSLYPKHKLVEAPAGLWELTLFSTILWDLGLVLRSLGSKHLTHPPFPTNLSAVHIVKKHFTLETFKRI